MADETTDAVIASGESAESIAAELEASETAAAAFFPEEPEQQAETVEAEQPAPEPAPEPVPAPTPPGPWAEAAERENFTKEQVAAFKDEQDAESQVISRRLQNLRSMGIEPQALLAFRQWQEQQAKQTNNESLPQGVAQEPVVPPAIPLGDLELKFDEEELAPELTAQLRAIEKHVNQLKGQLETQTANLQQTVQNADQQRASVERFTQDEARLGAEWDAAAKATPGFVEEFGVPSEIRRLPADDPRVQKFQTFTPYFGPEWQRHESARGAGNVILQTVVERAFAQCPYGQAKTNGTTTVPGPGSVVRSSSRKADPAPQSDDDDMSAELERTLKEIGNAWDDKGENPFGK